jgi:hypothetical protein
MLSPSCVRFVRVGTSETIPAGLSGRSGIRTHGRLAALPD